MSLNNLLENKIRLFINKYYKNQLIKGSILFFSIGLLYFFFTLFIEYFLWLQPLYRTILFWLFILVEIILLLKFICIPVFKLFGINKRLTETQAALIIGKHFPNVNDKLLNVLQLHLHHSNSDLLVASIDQKTKELQPVPFSKAINFKDNIPYLKYAILPIFIFFIIYITGNLSFFNHSINRVVHYNQAFSPPAPFQIYLQNTSLEVIKGKPITLTFKTVGNVIPSEMSIHFNNQTYYLQNIKDGEFSFTFTDTFSDVDFYVSANTIVSSIYQLKVIKTPSIKNLTLDLSFPSYTNRKNTTITNTGNILIPEGTVVQWTIFSQDTDTVTFFHNNKRFLFNSITNNSFSYKRKILQNTDYQIISSNINLVDYEKLAFSITTIKDQYPSISVSSILDSTAINTAHFVGSISDDYLLSKLQLVYYKESNPSHKLYKNIDIKVSSSDTFYANFPDDIELEVGEIYSVFFKVFDNDQVNGSKYSTSQTFTFKNKSLTELQEEKLKDQQNNINAIEQTLLSQKESKQHFQSIENKLKNNPSLNWSDKNKLNSFLQRQSQYKELMKKHTNNLLTNLNKQQFKESEKKDDLKKRLEELKELQKEQKLLDELKNLANKLNKEQLLNKVSKLSEQSKQEERSLERILELAKRFYVQEKTMQLANKLDTLAQQQLRIKNDSVNSLSKQKEVQDNFNNFSKEFNELNKSNSKLKEPFSMPDIQTEMKEASMNIKESLHKLSNNNSNSAKSNQQNSSDAMKKMSSMLNESMMSNESDILKMNIESLKMILKNLLNYSFQQEDLMNAFSSIDATHPNFGSLLKDQFYLKSYFEHIDDSLYVLSMKMPKLSTHLQTDLTEAHFNINQSLSNFSDNQYNVAISNQQYVMTAVNNIADLLSDILNKLNSKANSKGQGKGSGKGNSFSLPDLIKKQSDIISKMKSSMEKQSKEPNSNKGKGATGLSNNEESNQNLYKIYQQQAMLREQMENAIQQGLLPKNASTTQVLKSLEQLENEILTKGFNSSTIQRMNQLKYQFLKLDNASLTQNTDTKRTSKANTLEYQQAIKDLYLKKIFIKQKDQLQRESLPLQKNYKHKVEDYFNQTSNQK